MTATIYVVPGSHPSMAGRLMLERKQLDYRRVDLLPAIHKPALRVLGFRGTTVPALRIDGRRIQGTLTISRALDELRPDPPLFPSDPDRRARVEEAEAWGEAVLQPVPRRLSWWALARDRPSLRSFAEGARLHVPLGLAIRTSAPIIAIERRLNTATDAQVKADIAALPGLLDHVDELLGGGVLGGAEPNAADYQIATSVRLLLCFDDLRASIEARPAGPYALSLCPQFPGRVGRVIPPGWLEAAAGSSSQTSG
jgi:glutathione S-transferase